MTAAGFDGPALDAPAPTSRPVIEASGLETPAAPGITAVPGDSTAPVTPVAPAGSAEPAEPRRGVETSTNTAVIPAAAVWSAEPARSHSLQWPAVVALTSALVFAGLVAAGLFDPMIEAL
jgi:hypothetical protein